MTFILSHTLSHILSEIRESCSMSVPRLRLKKFSPAHPADGQLIYQERQKKRLDGDPVRPSPLPPLQSSRSHQGGYIIMHIPGVTHPRSEEEWLRATLGRTSGIRGASVRTPTSSEYFYADQEVCSTSAADAHPPRCLTISL